MCEPCQLKEFGGWPEGIVPPAATNVTTGTATTEQMDETADGEDEDGGWDLKKVYSMKDLNDPCPVKCASDTCTLQAAVVYVSNQTGKKWHGCLDCQVRIK